VTLGRDAQITSGMHRERFGNDLLNGSYQVGALRVAMSPLSPCSDLVQIFVVPFVASIHRALLCESQRGHLGMPIDLLASMLLTFSRFEESQSDEEISTGVSSPRRSVALKHKLPAPSNVDEYGLALQQVIRRWLPGWRPPSAKLHVKLSHDVDEIGFPPLSLQLGRAHGKTAQPLATPT